MFSFQRATGAVAAAVVAAGGWAFAQEPAPLSAPAADSLPSTDPSATGDATAGSMPAPGGGGLGGQDSAAPAGQPGSPQDAPGGFNWKQVPRVRPFPRPAFFPNPPTGPGYYSILDRVRGNELKAPPKWPYPRFGAIAPSFFDVDNFSYLDDPKNTQFDFFDPLKRVRFGPESNWLFTTGGEIRSRYENRYNDRLGQKDNIYELSRVRAYGDLWYKDDFRLFVEGIGAYSSNQDLTPLNRDENKADFLNLFIDAKIAEWDGKPAYLRVGRQELLLGSQRLVSTLDWANARRPFQGVRGFRQTEKWDFDAFWVQPVKIQENKLDSVDNNQNFAGTFATYRPKKGQAVDMYYFMLDNTNRSQQLGVQRSPFTFHTFGGRYAGNQDGFLFDAEAAMQLGSLDKRNHVAGFATAGAGYYWKDVTWTPTVWAYYDYASGGTNGNTDHTFNQLFPFGHYYMGWLDQVGRQNIHDLNFHLYMYPTKWLTSWVQFHSFWLASDTDALYNSAGNAVRRDATGRSGSHVGEEIDLVYNVHVTTHVDFLTGYSYLFGGEFLKNTAGTTGSVNSSFAYFQVSYRW